MDMEDSVRYVKEQLKHMSPAARRQFLGAIMKEDVDGLIRYVNEQAKQAYESMPEAVLEAADARTTAIQNHLRLPRNQRQGLSGKLAG